SVNQYMYFHFVCSDRGYDLLAGLFKRRSIDEMRHVELLAERILFLKGDVGMDMNIRIVYEKEVKKMLEIAMKLEEMSIIDYNKSVQQCAENGDSGTKLIFDELVKAEEKHYDQFEIEMENMDKFGDNYLALQSIERSKSNL
ncbi:MAG: ferritin-like domain-containing protein, partial [Rikenellaceae bacterium]